MAVRGPVSAVWGVARYVNPRTNLAQYFACGTNLNNIELLILLGHDFRSAATALELWLVAYITRRQSRSILMICPVCACHRIRVCIGSRRGRRLQNSRGLRKRPVAVAESVQRVFGNDCDHNSVWHSEVG